MAIDAPPAQRVRVGPQPAHRERLVLRSRHPRPPPGSGSAARHVIDCFTHLAADLVGVQAAQLRDSSLLSGLLIAGAGAAGLSPIGAPIVRRLPDERVTGFVLVDGGHMLFHALPDRELLLLDVLAPTTQDGRKALDVFVRRLSPRELRSDERDRG